MITIGFSTRENNSKFIDYIKKTLYNKNCQIIQKINNNEKSLSSVYNEIINEALNDIIVLIHDDIKIEKYWDKKLLNDFNENPEYSIIGKAGTCFFPESGIFWENMNQTMVGQVYHEPKNTKKYLSKYSQKLPFLIPVVSIDGLFISFNKNKISHFFDENVKGFHFYDHTFCLNNYLNGCKIGVTHSFEITHQSVGIPNEEFFKNKEEFLKKFKNILPLDLKPKKIHIPIIKEKKIKNIGKTAIIILSKHNTKILYECVKSFYDNCNSELFDIFIADTGSTKEEKEWIKNNILPLGNIYLKEYDYYNFAKINNDIYKKYIKDKYEFILFSNNDIKLLNNALYNMLKIFKTTKNVGTIGARLHYEDNTIQHDGILLGIINNKQIIVTHNNLKNYYNYNLGIKKHIGSTAALMMIKSDIFNKIGMFNEKYIECFEDVELNLRCIINGYDNYIDGDIVSYHYESLTRNNNKEKLDNINKDYINNLYPFIIDNFEKIKTYIKIYE